MIRKLLLFVLFYYCISFGQQYQYTTTWYTTDNGLPQNSIKDITKDKYGFIWINTENGIIRYDGANFITYQNFSSDSQRFNHFYGNRAKDSIFSFEGFGGTVLIHQRSPEVFKFKKRSQHNIILYKDQEYMLYCNSGYNYYNYLEQKFQNFVPVKGGNYYINKNFLFFKGDHTSATESIKIDNNKLINFFTIDNILFYLDPQTKKIKEILNGEIKASYDNKLLTDINTKLFWNQINNQVFFVNKDVLYRCYYTKGRFFTKKLVHITDSDDIYSVYYDKDYNKLYIGGLVKGLRVLKFLDFKVVKRKTGLPYFYATLPYDSSRVVTSYGEIFNHNGLVNDKHFYNDDPRIMFYDDEGNILVNSNKDLRGIFNLHLKNKNYESYETLPCKEVRLRDFFSHKGRYYIAVQGKAATNSTGKGGLLAVFKKRFYDLEKEYQFHEEITRITISDENHFLVGTINGLYKVSLVKNKIDKLNKEKIFVNQIIKSNDGHIWITTYGKGFYLLKGNTLINMPFDPAKNISTSHTILEDKKGFFWISTNNGLYRVLESELLKYSINKNKRVNYYKFTKNDGLSTDEFNGGGNVSGTKLKNGEFVLPSLDGLIFFNPLKVRNFYPKQVYVERIAVNNSQIKQFNEKLELQQNTSRATIFIDIPYFANTNNVVAFAKIDDSPYAEWEDIGKERKYTISNLSYGKYILTVKVLASDNEKYIYKKIYINVPPYFYQTLWFKILAITFVIGILYVLVRWRLNFLKKKNSELEKIVEQRTKSLSDSVDSLEILKSELHKENELQKKLIGTITHDITSPIKFIALSTEEILHRKGNDMETVNLFLSSINKSANQLYNFTRTLKEYADIYNQEKTYEIKEYHLYDFVQEKKVLFDEIAKKKNTEILNDIDEESTTTISKNILSAIIHNLLDNSVKFTQNGIIVIQNSWEGEDLILTVTDSGIGMDREKIEYYTNLQKSQEGEKLMLQKYGMGLHFIIQLLQMINSQIIIESLPEGTLFKLILKNKKK